MELIQSSSITILIDYALDAQAIFTEFYFDVADNHKLTLGLRYNEDTKKLLKQELLL